MFLKELTLIKQVHQKSVVFLTNDISIKNIDINKMVVCNKVSFDKKGFKYFTGHKDAKNKNFMCISPKNECI